MKTRYIVLTVGPARWTSRVHYSTEGDDGTTQSSTGVSHHSRAPTVHKVRYVPIVEPSVIRINPVSSPNTQVRWESTRIPTDTTSRSTWSRSNSCPLVYRGRTHTRVKPIITSPDDSNYYPSYGVKELCTPIQINRLSAPARCVIYYPTPPYYYFN